MNKASIIIVTAFITFLCTSVKAVKAVKVGEWEGDLDCCTPMQSFTSTTASILVTGPEDQ